MTLEIEAILFDFGGTLDYDGVDWFTRFYDFVLESAGDKEIAKERFFAAIKQSAVEMNDMDDIMQLNVDQTVVRWMTYAHEIIKNDKKSGSEWQQTAELWDPLDIASKFMEESHNILKRNIDTLEKLRGSYRLGCVSNNWGNIAGWCEQVNYDGFFEVMVDSALENSFKPDPVIFNAAINRMNLDPAKTVYVGDRYDADIIGSSGVGMIPLWLTGGTEKIEDNIVYMDHGLRQAEYSVKPVKIRSLTDVLQISELF